MKSTKKLLAYITGLLLLLAFAAPLYAYDNRDIYVQSENFSQDLDLNAVASLFGNSKDLADFEWRLNDPAQQISNLDLDGNGQVDYLRIIETTQYDIHLIVIQAVIGPDLYQDVATIEVARDRYNETTIQIVGDPYLYGRDYIIEPYYVYTPIIYSYFWGSRYYRPYYSHYRWGYYPRHYRSWKPRPAHYYSRHIRAHIDTRHRYKQTRVRKNHRAQQMHRGIRKNDYARKYPNRSYSKQHFKRDKRQMQTSGRRQSMQQKRVTHKTYNKNTTRKSSQQQQSHTRQQTSGRQRTDTRMQTQSRSRHQQRRSTQKRQESYRHQNRQSIQTRSLQQSNHNNRSATNRQSHSIRQTGTRSQSTTGRRTHSGRQTGTRNQTAAGNRNPAR